MQYKEDIFIELLSFNISSFLSKPLSFEKVADKLMFVLSHKKTLDCTDTICYGDKID